MTGILVLWVKLLPISGHARQVHVSVLAGPLPIHFSHSDLEKRVRVTQTFVFLLFDQGIWIQLLIPGFDLALPLTLAAIQENNQMGLYFSLYLSLYAYSYFQITKYFNEITMDSINNLVTMQQAITILGCVEFQVLLIKIYRLIN